MLLLPRAVKVYVATVSDAMPRGNHDIRRACSGHEARAMEKLQQIPSCLP